MLLSIQIIKPLIYLGFSFNIISLLFFYLVLSVLIFILSLFLSFEYCFMINSVFVLFILFVAAI